jgi:hypothetical protein
MCFALSVLVKTAAFVWDIGIDVVIFTQAVPSS